MAAALFHFREDQPISIGKNKINLASAAAPPMGQHVMRAFRIVGDDRVFSGQSGQMIGCPLRSFVKHRVTLRFAQPVI